MPAPFSWSNARVHPMECGWQVVVRADLVDPTPQQPPRKALRRYTIERLDWQGLPTKQAGRIALSLDEVGPADPAGFPHLHDRMLDGMQRFPRVFATRVKLPALGVDRPEDDA